MRHNKISMKHTKIFTAIVAFAGTFAIATALVWLFVGFPQERSINCWHGSSVNYRQPREFDYDIKSAEAIQIEAILQIDDQNGSVRNRTSNYFARDIYGADISAITDYSKAVKKYADQSGSMDVSDLPADFQTSWKAHMKAWRVYSDFLTQVSASRMRNNVSRSDLINMRNGFSGEISTTWAKVLRTSSIYGADVRGF